MPEESRGNSEFCLKNKIARIYYPWWGNAHPKNREWVLISPDGEVEDYHSRKVLVKQAISNDWKYQVERHHKKHRGTMTILEKNY
jgi:hypothetical protein